MGVVVAEYECSQYFDWKIQSMNVVRYEIPDSKHTSVSSYHYQRVRLVRDKWV